MKLRILRVLGHSRSSLPFEGWCWHGHASSMRWGGEVVLFSFSEPERAGESQEVTGTDQVSREHQPFFSGQSADAYCLLRVSKREGPLQRGPPEILGPRSPRKGTVTPGLGRGKQKRRNFLLPKGVFERGPSYFLLTGLQGGLASCCSSKVEGSGPNF